MGPGYLGLTPSVKLKLSPAISWPYRVEKPPPRADTSKMEAKTTLWDRLARPIGSALLVLFGVTCLWLTFGFQVAENRANFWDRVLALPATAENYFFDIRAATQYKAGRKEENLVVVKLDENALEAVGRWPWTRSKVADLLDRLHAYGTRTVALDVIFPEPENDAADSALAAAIQRFQEGDAGRTVVIGYGLAIDPEDGTPEVPVDLGFSIMNGNIGNQVIAGFRHAHRQNFVTPKVLEGSPTLGFIDAIAEADGVYRRSYLVADILGVQKPGGPAPQDRMQVPSLGVALYRAWYKRQKEQAFDLEPFGLGFQISYAPQGSTVKVPLDYRASLVTRWIGGEDKFPWISAKEIMLDPSPATNAKLKNLFEGKAVIVGATALAAGDVKNTPVSSALPGLYSHATVFHMLNTGYFYRNEDDNIAPTFAMLFLGVFLILLAARFHNPTWEALALAGSLGGVIAADQLWFLPNGYIVRLFFVSVTFTNLYAWLTFLNVFKEARERKRVRDAFTRYVAPDIVSEMLSNPDKLKVGGEKRELTMMFSDVRDFTSISEKLTAVELATLLNIYMGRMTDILFEHKGTLDKYIGDAMVAFWGAPVAHANHAEMAVGGALHMLEELPKINALFETKKFPQINVGLGLNTGEVNVGNMGSDRIFAYTALGDHMNLASRLEGLTKHYGVNLMISEFTLAALGASAGKYRIRPLDRVKVKGKSKPVEIFEVIPSWAAIAHESEMLDLYRTAYDLYMKADFSGAKQALERLLEQVPNDKPSKSLLERCEEWIQNPPPPDWDGVTTFTTK